MSSGLVQVTEFVGVGLGETQGIVIANVDPIVHSLMGIRSAVVIRTPLGDIRGGSPYGQFFRLPPASVLSLANRVPA